PLFGVGDGGHHRLRLVEQEVVKASGVRLDALAVELDGVGLGIRLAADLRHLPVDRHPPLADHLLRFPPGRDPRAGQDSLESLVCHDISSAPSASASASAISAASRRIRSSRSPPSAALISAISGELSAASDAIMSSVA